MFQGSLKDTKGENKMLAMKIRIRWLFRIKIVLHSYTGFPMWINTLKSVLPSSSGLNMRDQREEV